MAHKGKKKTRKSVNKTADVPGTSFGSKGKKSKKGITTKEFSQGYCVCK